MKTKELTVEIPLPPLALQQEFTRIVHKFQRLHTQQPEAERQAEHLFQTLLHRAFRGKLPAELDQLSIDLRRWIVA